MRKGFLAGLVLLLAGVYLLNLGVYVWDAGLCLGLGLLILGVTLCRVFYPPAPKPVVSAPVPLAEWFAARRKGVWRGVALGLALLVGVLARRKAPESDFTAVLGLWLLALGIFAATLPARVGAPSTLARLGRQEALALSLLLIAALLVRGVALGRVPANFGGDEGTQALLSLQLVERPLGNPFATSWYSVPTLSFLLYGAAMRLFGAGMAGARALSALVGTLTVLTTFLLAREMGGRRVGWVAALVVAFSAYHLHFSRLASNQIFDPLIATLTFWQLWRALYGSAEDETPAAWGWAGLAAGLGWYTYFGARWVTGMVGLFLVWRLLVEPHFWARHRHGLALLALGWLTMTAPLAVWYAAHPGDLTARANSVSIFASGWLTREMALTGRSALALLGQQFWKAATAFHLTPDPTFWYYPQAPLLDFISGTLLLVGMVAALLRARWPARGLTLLWFWSTLVLAWVMTENPPSSQRGLLLVPAVALGVGWGVEAIFAALPAPPRRKAAWLSRAMGLTLAIMALANLGFYFGVYTPRRTYGNPTAWVATEVAHYGAAHPAAGMTYFFGAPFLYWDFGTLAFLLRDQPGMDVLPNEIPEAVAPARFILVPERAGEFTALQARYPGGVVHELRAPDQRLLALIYDWPAP